MQLICKKINIVAHFIQIIGKAVTKLQFNDKTLELTT